MKLLVLIFSLVFVINVVSSERNDSKEKCLVPMKCQTAANTATVGWMPVITESEFNLLKQENAEIKKEDAETKKGLALLKEENVAIKGSFKKLLSSPSIREPRCYMGMKSGQIPDSAITASSHLYHATLSHAATEGRLDKQISDGHVAAWVPKSNTVVEWIQVDLGQPKVVAGVVTQGRPGTLKNQWVISYKVSCGIKESNMTTITADGQEQVFIANTDGNTKVENKFPQLMTCRYIRIYPQTFKNYMSMRLDIISGTCMDEK